MPLAPGWRRRAAACRGLRRVRGRPTIRGVDPVTHSLTGAALARAGLARATPLAAATLVLGANAPDIDALVYASDGAAAALACRRGLTHGPLALLLLPLLVAAVILLYDRWWRRRRSASADAARAGPVLGLAFLGVLTHPALDWLNTYGIRLLMPFSDRWFYGDALFIIDPWVWLALAAPLLAFTTSRRGRRAWVALGVAASLMVLMAPQVPTAARAVWVAAVLALSAYTAGVWRGSWSPAPGAGTRGARAALLAVAAYIGAMVASDQLARGETLRAAAAAGLVPHDIMLSPTPANPLAAEIVVEVGEAYHFGRFDWLATPRVSWEHQSIPLGERTAAVLATLQLQEVRDFLRWSRFPYVQELETAEGHEVRFGDARYRGMGRGGLGGVRVLVEEARRR
jgi:inner membrane protein